jgi:cation transport ATPase
VSDPADEHDRVAEDAKRIASAAEAEERARAGAKQATADALTGENGEETVRQQGLIYAGLIGIAMVMIQAFLAAASLDISAMICVVAFSVSVPLLGALVMVNRQEAFRRRRTPSASVTITKVVAQLAAFIGIAAGFWHVTWVAGVAFLVAGFVAVLVHSAGYWRLESKQEASLPG